MKSLKAFFLISILILITGCFFAKTGKESALPGDGVKTDLQGQTSITGAYALHPLVMKMAEDFMALHPGVKILVKRTGQRPESRLLPPE
jgi:ABC-type phosphate transport system substrate-binding protein